MTLETKLTHPPEYLECFRPSCPPDAWKFVAIGDWSKSPHHAGRCVYEIAKNERLNTWIIAATDIIEPDENDDEQCRDNPSEVHIWSEIIAICRDAPDDATINDMAKEMYDELWDLGLGLDK